MTQFNQGKITIQQGEKDGENLKWGPVIGEKEYLYFGEAKEAAEMFSWQQAEDVCQMKLDASPAILVKPWRKKEGLWDCKDERVVLLFSEEF
jgi:hypothetical protein